MIDVKKQKLDEKDFLFNIESNSCNFSGQDRKELEEKIEKLNSIFTESSERKKLLRL